MCTRARLLCGVSRHNISACHTVNGLFVLVVVRICCVVSSGSRGLLQVLVEAAGLAAASQGVARRLALAALTRLAQHVGQGVAVGGWGVISPAVTVACAEAVRGGHRLGGGSCALGGVGAWPGGLEGGYIALAGVQGVMWGAILAVAVNFHVGVVARAGAAVVPPLAVAHAEGE